MKKILLMMLLAFSLLLVACTPTDGDKDNDEPTAQEIFEAKFQFLEDNNYELEIKVTDHQALDDTVVMMYFDGDIVKYEDGSYVAYYDNSESQSKIHVKQGDTYAISDADFDEDGLLYYGFEFEQFSVNNATSYLMKQDQYGSLDTFIGLEGEVTGINSLQVRVNDTHVTEVIFNIVVGETTYLVTLTISNVGQVNLVLPA
ncbi:MAG: hypothetical protein WCZ19_02290 [Acholeplasma sp.]